MVDAGFTLSGRRKRIRRTGVSVDLVAADADGETWHFDVAGPFTSYRGGLLRTEEVWKRLGRASALHGAGVDAPFVLLTTHLPRARTDADTALRAAGPGVVFDVVDLLDGEALDRLRRYAKGGHRATPQPGFWAADDLAGRPLN
jgi:hypothetical protein